MHSLQMGTRVCKCKESRGRCESQVQPITSLEMKVRLDSGFISNHGKKIKYSGLFLNSKFQADMITQV